VRRAERDIAEAGVREPPREVGAVEAVVVAVGVGVVELALVVVEVAECHPATGAQEPPEPGEEGRDVVDVVQRQQAHHKVESRLRALLGGEVEAGRLPAGEPRGRELAPHHLQHARGGVGQQRPGRTRIQGEAEQAGAAAELEQVGDAGERHRLTDRAGDGDGAGPFRVVVPAGGLGVECAHVSTVVQLVRTSFLGT